MQNIPAVANGKPLITNAEFVKLTIFNDATNISNITIHTFSSSYQAETINGLTYSPLGGLLAVGAQQRDMRVTSADTSVSLSGIGGNNIFTVLNTRIKGSQLEILRGFYNNNYILSNTAQRFTGIVTSYNISEERHDLEDIFTVTLNASSFKSVLENRIAGRNTNQSSWQTFNSSDTSMNRVYSIAGTTFDFGAPVTAKTGNPSGSALQSQTTSSSNPFRGPR